MPPPAGSSRAPRHSSSVRGCVRRSVALGLDERTVRLGVAAADDVCAGAGTERCRDCLGVRRPPGERDGEARSSSAEPQERDEVPATSSWIDHHAVLPDADRARSVHGPTASGRMRESASWDVVHVESFACQDAELFGPPAGVAAATDDLDVVGLRICDAPGRGYPPSGGLLHPEGRRGTWHASTRPRRQVPASG